MKNTKYLFVLVVLSQLFFNCSSNESNSVNSTNYKELIIGEWQYIKYQRETNGIIVTENIATECQAEFGKQIYSNNNTFEYYFGGGTTLNNCSPGQSIGTYEVVNDLIITSIFNDWIIVELNSRNLVYKFRVMQNCDETSPADWDETWNCDDWNIYTYQRLE